MMISASGRCDARKGLTEGMEAELKEDLGKRYPANLIVDVLVLDRANEEARIRRRATPEEQRRDPQFVPPSQVVPLEYLRLLPGKVNKLSGKRKK